MIDGATLAKMKPGALLINVARGNLVDTAALVEALAVRADSAGRGWTFATRSRSRPTARCSRWVLCC